MLILLACFAVGIQAQSITIAFEANTPLRKKPLPPEYVSFNIDSASLGYNFDFKDRRLTNLVKQISHPGAILRLGGTASTGVVWTGVGGRRSPCPGSICINAEYWDEIHAFLRATGVKLLFDFSGSKWFNASGDWDPNLNATQQMNYTNEKGYTTGFAWQLGNEGTSGRTATQWGQNFVNLKHAMARFPKIGQMLIGPSSSISGATQENEFLSVTKGALNGFSYHHYGPNITIPPDMKSVRTHTTCHDQRARVDAIDPNTWVVWEESACAPLGGHDGVCNRFASGFYWIHALTIGGELGCDILHRQDIAGYSFPGMGSKYTLAGPPGWANESTWGPLEPHPDWYTTVLFKQLAGLVPLGGVKVTGDAEAVNDVDAHIWCGAEGTAAAGKAVFIYSNGHTASVTVQSINGIPLSPRVEFILTPTANARSKPPVPSDLQLDEIYLNGVKMTVDSNAMLPVIPVPGHSVSAADPLVLPAFSYGFVQLTASTIPACR
jgi:hypothetical protein